MATEISGLRTEAQKRFKVVEHRFFAKTVDFLEKHGILNWFGEEVKTRLPKVINVTGITPEFSSKFVGLLRENCVPLIGGAHFVHLDGAVISEGFAALQNLAINESLGENLTGAVLPLAASLPNGKQDRFMQIMYPKLDEFVRERRVEPVAVVREKDKLLYGMEQHVLSQNRPLVSKLRQKGMAVIVFPYASIQAGRHPEGSNKDEIFGLQELIEPNGEPKLALVEMYNQMEKSGKRIRQRPFFQPVGLSRTYRLQNPDSYRPTPEGIVSLYDSLSLFSGLFGFKRVIADVNFGDPITGEDMVAKIGSKWLDNPKDVNTCFMEVIARLVLPKERGFYAYVGKELSLAA